jgi:hypothetical protein
MSEKNSKTGFGLPEYFLCRITFRLFLDKLFGEEKIIAYKNLLGVGDYRVPIKMVAGYLRENNYPNYVFSEGLEYGKKNGLLFVSKIEEETFVFISPELFLVEEDFLACFLMDFLVSKNGEGLIGSELNDFLLEKKKAGLISVEQLKIVFSAKVRLKEEEKYGRVN